MKMFFFLVALANVALFMWEYNKSTGYINGHAETLNYDNLESIVLVSELKQGEVISRPAPHDVKTAEPQNPQVELGQQPPFDGKAKEAPLGGGEVMVQASEKEALVCYEAGPFADSNVFKRWQKELANVESVMVPVSREEQSISDYLVYYPSDTPEQTASNLLMLRSQGHPDAWILSQGSARGGISLGVFKKEERAQSMKGQLETKGIHVEIMPRFKKQVQTYVLIKGGMQMQGSLKSLEKSYPGVAIKPSENCSTP